MQHDNAANCLADELLGLLQRLENQLPTGTGDLDLARGAGAKSVVDSVLEVIDRRLPSGPDCTCTDNREDTK